MIVGGKSRVWMVNANCVLVEVIGVEFRLLFGSNHMVKVIVIVLLLEDYFLFCYFERV